MYSLGYWQCQCSHHGIGIRQFADDVDVVGPSPSGRSAQRWYLLVRRRRHFLGDQTSCRALELAELFCHGIAEESRGRMVVAKLNCRSDRAMPFLSYVRRST